MRVWLWISCLVLGIAGLAVMLVRFSPIGSEFWVVPIMYAAVFLSFYGFASICGFVLRKRFWTGVGRNEILRTSGRQGALFGFMGVIVLIMLAQNFFSWWSAALLMAIFILLELYAR